MEEMNEKPKKLVYISVVKNGSEVLKTPVRSVEMVVGFSQVVDENTSVTLAVEYTS